MHVKEHYKWNFKPPRKMSPKKIKIWTIKRLENNDERD